MELPKFKLARVMSDGTENDPKILPVEQMPADINTNRRGFLGAGLTAMALLATQNLLSRQKRKHSADKDLNAHDSSIKSLHFTRNGNTLISVARDDLKIWSLPERKLRGKIKNFVACIALSPDDQKFAIPLEKRIEIRSIKNTSIIKSIDLPAGHPDIVSLCFTPDSKFLLATSTIDQVSAWDCTAWKKGSFLSEQFNKKTGHVIFTQDSRLIISVETIQDTQTSKFTESLNVRSATDGKLIKILSEFDKKEQDPLIILSNDSKRLLFLNSGSASYQSSGGTLFPLKIYNLETLEMDYSYELDDSRSFALSPDGLKIFAHTRDALQLWQSPNISKVQKSILAMLALPDYEKLKEPIETLCTHSGLISAIAVSPVGTIVASGDLAGVIKLSDWSKRLCLGFVFDPKVNESDGVSYNIYNKETGQTYSYTLPCGSPIPGGAVCTCNCVAGTKPVYHAPTYHSGGVYCTCDTVCTCIPVCQAHKLSHPDKFVRLLSRQILLFMGSKEADYMNWAADNSKITLRKPITSLINEIRRGIKPNYLDWPPGAECEKYLQDDDEVVSVMAAQMINMQHKIRRQPVSGYIYQRVESLLAKSEEMYWKKRIQQ